VRNSPDNESGILNSIWEQRLTVTEVEERMKLFRAEDSKDRDIRQYMGLVTINLCKIHDTIKKNIVINTILENFVKTTNTSVSCPFLKGTKQHIVDQQITDKFIPPILQETRFRLEVSNYQKIQGQKKFTKLYTAQYFVSIKKPLV
jgi:glutaredoxin-related protein